VFTPLVQRMIERCAYPVLSEEALADFLVSTHEAGKDAVLFFTGEGERFPETNDVAMILPELVGAFGGRFSAAVIALPDQHRLQMRYGFREWPTLVFLRGEGENYLGAISRVQDWHSYLEEIDRLLAAQPAPPPDFLHPVSSVSVAFEGGGK